MNSKLNYLFSRRSIRKYKSADVEGNFVRDLLEAAMAAPSAVAKDPWAFVVIRDRAGWLGLPKCCRTAACSPRLLWGS